jgi:arylsulfatase A-like enzyme
MLVELVDILPTLLDLTGIDAPCHLVGNSLGPILRGLTNDPYPQQNWRKAAFCEIENGRMIRTNNWKLCHYSNDTGELYDLSTDPDEKHNRYNDPNCSTIRASLTEQLLSHIIEHPTRFPLNT